MKVDIYFGRGAGHQDTVQAMVKEALEETGESGAEVAVFTVDSPEDARSKKMLGSPTVRVNGFDVEYGDREPDEKTNGQRYYSTPDGWKPTPHKGMVVRAIENAKAREKRASA